MNSTADPLFAATQRALAGHYSVERELGRGGMGVVYLAREVELDRYVALKVLPLGMAGDPETRSRFLREARVAASLSHPNVVPIYRVGEVGDVVYFSMAFVDGETLGERLRTRGPVTPTIATRLLREVAQALAYSHGRGIIHRDIKPDNILIERESGRAMVSDFGIAAAHDVSADDRVAGTVHFMSPEHSAGATVDARSDLYSLGVVGHLALSGRLPKRSESLAASAPSTAAHLIEAIDRATRANPDERHASAEAFVSALESAAIVRADTPAPLSAWLNASDPWRVPYVVWTAMMCVVAGFEYSQGAHIGDAIGTAVLGLLSVVPATLFQLRIARHAFDAGYSIDDLRAALGQWRAERAAHDATEVPSRAPWWHAAIRFWSWSAVATYVSVVLTRGAWQHWAITHTNVLVPTVISGLLGLPVLSALGVPVLPRFLRAPEKSLSGRFWNSKLGEWTEKALMHGRSRGIPSRLFRATEHVLGGAVDDLFNALPTAFREQLRDLPNVVDRLQSLAAEARASLAHFDGVTAVARDADLARGRESARRQLADSVGALETIRLDLLRLAGGDVDLRATTTVLDAARRVDSDLRRLRASKSEVERSVRPIGLDLRPHTPA